MVAVPAAAPVTMPVEPTVAVGRAVLLHIPPVVALCNAVVLPAQTLSVPVMGAGDASTLIVAVVVQPLPSE
jgi:hypothetical protein